MKRIVGLVTALLMMVLVAFTILPASRAEASKCVGDGRTITFNMRFGDDEIPTHVRAWSRATFKRCGENTVITGFQYYYGPNKDKSKKLKCRNIEKFVVNPEPVAGKNPGPTTIPCTANGTSRYKDARIVVLPETRDRNTTINVKAIVNNGFDQKFTAGTFGF